MELRLLEFNRSGFTCTCTINLFCFLTCCQFFLLLFYCFKIIMYHSYLFKIGNSDTCIRFLDIQYIWQLPLNAVGKARSGCLEKRCREGAMLHNTCSRFYGLQDRFTGRLIHYFYCRSTTIPGFLMMRESYTVTFSIIPFFLRSFSYH